MERSLVLTLSSADHVAERHMLFVKEIKKTPCNGSKKHACTHHTAAGIIHSFSLVRIEVRFFHTPQIYSEVRDVCTLVSRSSDTILGGALSVVLCRGP